ncbi:MAG: hypothetical protein JW809_15145 [Pirellulales bacterium]|nr:hypothetical protein [Pirellulales bacterium]
MSRADSTTRSSRRRLGLAVVALCSVLGLALAGCSRAFYRRQADREVQELVECAASRAGADATPRSIQPDRQSRMFDPNCPDCPPMPPDDPRSHELMQCVDGKRGWPHWHRCGDTPYVENPDWAAYLPRDDDGAVVLDREGAVRLALRDSREYQQQLENLYLSALDVTFQRFQFDAQFFGGNSTFYDAQGRVFGGGRAQSLLSTDTAASMRKLYATGGELVVGVANSLVWQFAGPDDYDGRTLLDFSLVQPLLRAGGRAVVLEQLTDAERALLANIRQMERYRRGFYLQIVTGRAPGPGPSRGGIGLGGLDPGGGAAAGGILALLRQQVVIRNQNANVVSLRASLEQLKAFFDAGEIEYFQVEQTRLQLYQAEIRLLDLQNQYQTALDAYKIRLGLPPSLEIKIEDDLVDRFQLIDPALTEAQDQVTRLLERIRDPKPGDTLPAVAAEFDEIASVCLAQIDIVRRDLDALDAVLPRRRAHLARMTALDEVRHGQVDRAIFDPAELDDRVGRLRILVAEGSNNLHRTLDQLADFQKQLAEGALRRDGEELTPAEARGWVKETVAELSSHMVELSLLEAESRLESITLNPLRLSPEKALRIARENRRDWQNARAALVDRWRQVEIAANDLESDLDLTFSGDLRTIDSHPLRFRGTNGRLRVGLAWDAPLTRLAERNAYREALIGYQQARREYYAYEDRVSQALRQTLRDVRLAQIKFEQRRAAVYVAATQVDEKQIELLRKPAEPGSRARGSTTARDVVDALNGLLEQQNDFLGVWVDHEAQRANLIYDLGIMRLDEAGMWVDEDEFDEDNEPDAGKTDELFDQEAAADDVAPPEDVPTPPEADVAPPEDAPAPRPRQPAEPARPPGPPRERLPIPEPPPVEPRTLPAPPLRQAGVRVLPSPRQNDADADAARAWAEASKALRRRQ